MPRSVFLGRVVAPGEPLWLPEDRWWALALLEAEDGVCGDCGQPLAEALSPESEFQYDAEVVRCHGCAAAARRVKAINDGGGHMEASKVRVWRREE